MANKPQIIHSYGRMTTPVTEMVPRDDGPGKVCREVRRETGVVLLQIDIDKLRGLALRALRNKNKRAAIFGGGVVAIVKRSTVKETSPKGD